MRGSPAVLVSNRALPGARGFMLESEHGRDDRPGAGQGGAVARESSAGGALRRGSFDPARRRVGQIAARALARLESFRRKDPSPNQRYLSFLPFPGFAADA